MRDGRTTRRMRIRTRNTILKRVTIGEITRDPGRIGGMIETMRGSRATKGNTPNKTTAIRGEDMMTIDE